MKTMKVRVKVCLVDERGQPFMGIGLVWLLSRIRRFHSIRRAAQDMGMSYVKAHSILKRLEKCLSRPLLVRSRGGAEKGGAELTPFADEFLADYERLGERVARVADKEAAPLIRRLRSRA
ncbi:MAG: LysR family transcriptional regulator [Elusimicrobia bacterium]|nr:LysR family transcriptional regulator [Elusimicrobiota bacterium]